MNGFRKRRDRVVASIRTPIAAAFRPETRIKGSPFSSSPDKKNG
jgi:hypothetical protein